MSIENLKTFGEQHSMAFCATPPTLKQSLATCKHLVAIAAPQDSETSPAILQHPFAEADEDTGETKQSQNYIHIRIQQRNGRKTLTTVQGLPKKFDQKKILKVIKKKFACNGTIVNDTEMGEVIQLQGDQRKDVQEFLVDKKEGLELDAKTIKVHGF
ncbi:Eukaryotic translation initiation factor eIF-1 [Lepraria neglecta]|uniref:Eukaryotic translation initiation factor eIF-1 n=1 Tax=Lepraria neglecta TaxID=209136 RepID=A0AAD9ZAJ6_9LECA|nr:Eukaryotic translation initiation factor eIF-1 [Lepraria neglecta]